MFSHKFLFKAGFLLMLSCLLVPVLAACGGSGTTGPVTLTVWSWVPNLQDEVNLFEKSHPDIKIKLENAGQSAPEYTKLQTAFKANSGAPDVVQIEYSHLPEFILTGKLVDLSQYGASAVKNDFIPWTMTQAMQGSKIYGIPQDTGPLGLLYRKDIFAKYHLAVPTTWAQFAQESVQLHKDDPSIYLTNYPTNDAAFFEALSAQAGSLPFSVSGTTVGISLNNAGSIKVANYWNTLISEKAAATTPDFTNDWYAGLGNGTYASWITAAWGPVFLSGVAAKSAGDWAVAPLPQWSAGQDVSANWGGSVDAVTTQSQHPAQAAEFAIWLNHDPTSSLMLAQKQYLFPVLTSTLNNSAIDVPYSFFGGQKINTVFTASSKHINTNYQWSPFQSYVDNQIQNQMSAAGSGKYSLAQALQNVQASTVTYAKNQGFTVK
jgi:multiple sugar transport system substrate-binding protein